VLTIYPDIGLRPMVIWMYWCRTSRITEAVQIARHLVLGFPNATIPEPFPGLNNFTQHETCLQKDGSSSTLLEIHHSLMAIMPFYMPFHGLVFGSRPSRWEAVLASDFQSLRMLTPTAQVCMDPHMLCWTRPAKDAPFALVL